MGDKCIYVCCLRWLPGDTHINFCNMVSQLMRALCWEKVKVSVENTVVSDLRRLANCGNCGPLNGQSRPIMSLSAQHHRNFARYHLLAWAWLVLDQHFAMQHYALLKPWSSCHGPSLHNDAFQALFALQRRRASLSTTAFETMVSLFCPLPSRLQQCQLQGVHLE